MWEKYKDIVSHISVESGVINHVADWVSSNGYKNILVVSDPNTRRVAGKRVIDSLIAAGLCVFECKFTMDEPLPDEHSIGILTAAYSPEIDLILGVGSGTINDICTYVGAKVGCPSAIVGTAASMDGYASLGSAMLLSGLKVTPPSQCAVAIFCDIDILSEAPMILTAAGLGDMLGKLTALADWRLSHLLVGEPMPEDIVSLVENALTKITAGIPHLSAKLSAHDHNLSSASQKGSDEAYRDAIKSITEGLILTGIAMSIYGDSRPASGTEHHLAHFWEMRMHAEDRTPALHGIKVGLATIVGLELWKNLANTLCTDQLLPKNAPPCATDSYESDIRQLYGHSAENVLLTSNPNLSYEHIISHKQAILKIVDSLPSPEAVAEMLRSVGAPIRPSDINLSKDTLYNSVIYSRDRKKTYTVLQLLGDLGLLEIFAQRICTYFENVALKDIKCFVLDMDGTIYLGDNLFPFTTQSLDILKSSGKDFVFYTNNSSQNSAHYINKLQRMKIEITPDKLLMSTHVLLAHLEKLQENSSLGRHVFVSGTKALRDDFMSAGYTLTETYPDFVVLGFDTDMDYARLTMLCDFVRAGLPYFGVHVDYNCPILDGFIPDCGSLAAAVKASTGVIPDFFGKPSRHTLDYIINKTGYRENELCFIGDRMYTDIAIASGTQASSILVLSGETKANDLKTSEFIPDLVLNDLSELGAYL
ncbi:MAG: iron-containing alcohol dehydrogenase [Oscillospiraceae bacterium]|nr:iron-containing alcohol dehydrogenase [Oscillospiraceae bacterium]